MNPDSATWRSFSAAPHRLFFCSGVLYAVIAVGLWSVQQASLYTSWLHPVVWHLPFPQAHGFMMIYGLFGFYFFGFLLTTFPRWLDAQPVPRPVYLWAWLSLSAGALMFWLGLFFGVGFALAGVLATLLGYLLATGQCVLILLRTTQPQRSQQVFICYGLAMGAAGIVLTGVAMYGGQPWAYRAARWIGIYPFLLQVIFTVIYRMVPFFTQMVTPGYELRRTALAVPVFSAALAARAVLGYAELHALAWPADLVLLAVLAREMVLWRFWRANFPPLLAVLYLALFWFLASFTLSLGEGVYLFLTQQSVLPFRNAALHALTVGGFGGLLLGISTRVSLGHSGRGLATERWMNVLFFGYQAIPLARVAPEVGGYWLPALGVHGFWAGIGWVAVFGIWYWRIAPVLMRPRSDGRPG